MGKKKPPRQWIVHLETTYRGDRNERIAKAFALQRFSFERVS